MNTANRVIKNTGFLYAKMGITIFISLYTTRLILNALGASDFGIFNVVGGAIAMLGFLNAAMASATQRFMSYSEGEGDKEKQKRIFNISIVLHFGIALVVGLVLLIAGFFFFHGILNIALDRIFAAKVVYGSLIISTMFTVMTVPYDAVLNAHENMFYYAIVGIIESLLKLAVALTVVHASGDKLILYGILMACIPFITMTIMRVYCHKRYEECTFAPKRYWEMPLVKEMTGFAGWNFLGAASSMITNYGQGILLNMFFGSAVNAAQGITNQISGQIGAFAQNLLKAVAPVVVKSEGEGDRVKLQKATMFTSKASFFLWMFFSIPLIIQMPSILKIWLKEVPEYTVIFCRLYLIRILIDQLTVTISQGILAVGVIKRYKIITSVLTILILPAAFVMFSLGYSPQIIYEIFIISACAFLIINTLFAKVLYGLKIMDYLRKVLISALCPFFILLFVSIIYCDIIDANYIGLIGLIITNAISFIVVVYKIGLTSEERNLTLCVIKELKARLK